MRELGIPHEEACVLGNLASVYVKQGMYGEAASSYELAIGIYRELGDDRGEADALRELGLALRAMHDEAAATRHLRDALALFETFDASEAESARTLIPAAAQPGQVLAPGPDAGADPQGAAALNRRYIEGLARWETLPWLRRRVVRRPQRPRGI